MQNKFQRDSFSISIINLNYQFYFKFIYQFVQKAMRIKIHRSVIVCVLIFCPVLLIARKKPNTLAVNNLSPFYQKLPKCQQQNSDSNSIIIEKKTSATGLLCPMIRDETGFLSEWVAYYQIHGFNHVRFYDHGSSDNYDEELGKYEIIELMIYLCRAA
jgi:hypothetical protein